MVDPNVHRNNLNLFGSESEDSSSPDYDLGPIRASPSSSTFDGSSNSIPRSEHKSRSRTRRPCTNSAKKDTGESGEAGASRTHKVNKELSEGECSTTSSSGSAVSKKSLPIPSCRDSKSQKETSFGAVEELKIKTSPASTTIENLLTDESSSSPDLAPFQISPPESQSPEKWSIKSSQASNSQEALGLKYSSPMPGLAVIEKTSPVWNLEELDFSLTSSSDEEPNAEANCSKSVGENPIPDEPPLSVEEQLKNEFGDKMTVQFKVNLPSVDNDLLQGPTHFLRMPQFIPIESGAFKAATFENQLKPEDLKDEQARGDFVNRLKTTVRWRENQMKVKESNARLVRWSDGSETFHVGAEVFDVMHHPGTDGDQNQLYVRLDSCYQPQGFITDKMTLRPKLDSTFGQSHVQGLRNRAMNKPQTGCVKVLMDMGFNPVKDRERRIKEEMAQLRREERERRRDLQMSQRKPPVKPMHHCTADDSDDDVVCLGEPKINSGQGIRTNRNGAAKPSEFEDIEDLTSGSNDEDNEPRPSTSKPRKSNHSDSDESLQARNVKRKVMQLVYSDSD